MLKVDRDKFTEALTEASRYCSAHNIKPVLGCVKIDSVGGDLSLKATDLEGGISLGIECDGELGDVCVPSKELLSFCQLADDGDLSLSLDGTALAIESSRSKARFRTMAGDDFPSRDPLGEVDRIGEIPAQSVESLRRFKAVCSQDSNAALSGVLMEFASDKVSVVATDRRCMAVGSAAGEYRETKVVLPSSFCARIRTGSYEVYSDGNVIEFRNGSCTAWTRLLEGNFIRWQIGMLDKSDSPEVDVPLAGLLNMTRIATIANDELLQFQSDLRLEDGTLTVERLAGERGDASADMPVAYDQDPVKVTVNAKKLGDVTKIIPSDIATMAIINNFDVRFDADDFTYVASGS